MAALKTQHHSHCKHPGLLRNKGCRGEWGTNHLGKRVYICFLFFCLHHGNNSLYELKSSLLCWFLVIYSYTLTDFFARSLFLHVGPLKRKQDGGFWTRSLRNRGAVAGRAKKMLLVVKALQHTKPGWSRLSPMWGTGQSICSSLKLREKGTSPALQRAGSPLLTTQHISTSAWCTCGKIVASLEKTSKWPLISHMAHRSDSIRVENPSACSPSGTPSFTPSTPSPSFTPSTLAGDRLMAAGERGIPCSVERMPFQKCLASNKYVCEKWVSWKVSRTYYLGTKTATSNTNITVSLVVTATLGDIQDSKPII